MSAAGAPVAQADAATANAAIARQALRAVGAGGRRDLSRVSVASTDLPTPEELISWYMATCELKLIIRERHAGGKAKTSGRYKKHDSARLHYIETVIIPDLKMGKTPNAYDAHIVYNMPGPDNVSPNDAHILDAWASAIKPDPRSKAAAPSARAGMPDADQPTLLSWAHGEDEYLTSAGPTPAKRGRPPSFRFAENFSTAEIKGMTIDQVISADMGWVLKYFAQKADFVRYCVCSPLVLVCHL